VATHTYNALNQIRPVPSTAASLYDLDGNQRVTIAGWQHHWDAANRLTNSVNGAHQIVNTFDSDHRRVRKQVYADGALTADTTFVYDGWYLVAELTHTPTHATTNLYVWGADRYGMHNETPGVASKDSSGGVRALLAIVASGSDKTPEVFYPVMNDHGDVMALLDVTGSNIVARYEYDPWGNVLSATGPAATLCPFRWQTKYFDNETRL
jgi:hypothetical protein